MLDYDYHLERHFSLRLVSIFINLSDAFNQLFIDLFSILSNMFFYPSLLLHVQYRKGDRLINQQEAHVDEEFDGTAAVVG